MRIHFIAVGGSVMHSLALVLYRQGHHVTGSDDAVYDPARSRLASAGLLPPEPGWFPERITSDLDAVIVGMHARPDNPELEAARCLGIPLYSFPSFMTRTARDQRRVVVAGSHGKTTITSALLFALRHQGISCTYLVGACPPGYTDGLDVAPDAKFAVFEGDEYPAAPWDPRPKFLVYEPQLALISGIAWDHANIYPDPRTYTDVFRRLIEALPSDGVLVYNASDTKLRDLVRQSAPHCETVPYETPEYRVVDGVFSVHVGGRRQPVRLIGRHNLENLAGAACLAERMGIPRDDFWSAAGAFPGAPNRLARLAAGKDRIVFRDFAHAPSKVRATVAAVREAYPALSVVACLELHTFSSLDPAFLPEYRGTLDQADVAAVFIDPEAAERKGFSLPEPGRLISCFARRDLRYFTDRNSLESFLLAFPPHSVLLLMSSGHFGGLDMESLARSPTARRQLK